MGTLVLEKEFIKEENYKKITFFINIFAILSAVSYMLCVHERYESSTLNENLTKIILSIVIIVALSIILFKFKRNFILDTLKMGFKNINYIAFSILSTFALLTFIAETDSLQLIEKLIFGILSSFIIFIFFLKSYLYLVPKIINFFKTLSRNEKKYLLYASIFYTILLLITTLNTRMFLGISLSGRWYEVFSFDTASTYAYETLVNPYNYNNNIRHLLMSYVTLPFTAFPFVLFKSFHAVFIFYFFYIVAQEIMVISIIILLKRLIKIENSFIELSFYLLATVSSTFIINFLVNEKFVISILFLVLAISATINQNDSKFYYFFMSLASLTSNILLFIPIFFYKTNIKKGIKNTIIFGLLFLLACIVAGQAEHLVYVLSEMNSLNRFTGDEVSFSTRLIMFFVFMTKLFFIPNSCIKRYDIWETEPTVNSFYFWIGIIIFVITILGFILNRKNSFMKICFYWFIIMIVYSVLIGWGTGTNELFLNSIMYFWAIIPLIFIFIVKIAKKPKIILGICIILGTITLAMNGIQFYDLMVKSHSIYPMF